MERRRVIIGISGASGAVYGVRCLDLLGTAGFETHLVISRAGEMTLKDELGLSKEDLKSRCDVFHAINNVGASIASGSFRNEGMIVAPCSIKTLSEIVTGTTSTLLTRAADVVLKERRKLILMVRETPLHLGHLRSMTLAAEMGAMIFPPVPAFYTKPTSLDDIVQHSVARVLDHFAVEVDISRWAGRGQSGGEG